MKLQMPSQNTLPGRYLVGEVKIIRINTKHTHYTGTACQEIALLIYTASPAKVSWHVYTATWGSLWNATTSQFQCSILHRFHRSRTHWKKYEQPRMRKEYCSKSKRLYLPTLSKEQSKIFISACSNTFSLSVTLSRIHIWRNVQNNPFLSRHGAMFLRSFSVTTKICSYNGVIQRLYHAKPSIWM